MAIKTTARKMPDTYFELVKRFPLVRIRDEDDLQAAQAAIDHLLKQDLDTGEQEYLDVLTDLVEAFEEAHVSIPDASEADVLRELMSANRLTQASLAKQTGISQSTISSILQGKRSLTRKQVVTLAQFFHVPAGVFLSS